MVIAIVVMVNMVHKGNIWSIPVAVFRITIIFCEPNVLPDMEELPVIICLIWNAVKYTGQVCTTGDMTMYLPYFLRTCSRLQI